MKLVDKMKPTGSAGEDEISMRMIKDARQELQPLLLVMVNQTISTTDYPSSLKTTKIVPIEKKGEDEDDVGRVAARQCCPRLVENPRTRPARPDDEPHGGQQPHQSRPPWSRERKVHSNSGLQRFTTVF